MSSDVKETFHYNKRKGFQVHDIGVYLFMWLYIGIILLVVIAAIATLIIGNSTENKSGNPDYDNRTKKNLVKLTLIYGVSILLIGVLLTSFLSF
ncbi:hypothetical protein D3C81_1566050 [compost metagenome]